MGWTDSTTVKKHLLDLDRLPTDIENVVLRLDASGDASFPHGGIVEDSETVKVKLQLGPIAQAAVSLNGETWTALNHDYLVAGEIVVADGEDLGTVYQLDADYCFNEQDGELRRISSGSIGDGASVQVYYQRFSVLTKDVDYTIDYATGELAMGTVGALEPDTQVWVDYQLSAAAAIDALVSEAITETEDKILSMLKPDYTADSTDQGLITGATELTMATLCRSLATHALADGAPAAEGRSRGWRELSDRYNSAAMVTLRRFIAYPTMTSGSKKGNSSWEWV